MWAPHQRIRETEVAGGTELRKNKWDDGSHLALTGHHKQQNPNAWVRIPLNSNINSRATTKCFLHLGDNSIILTLRPQRQSCKCFRHLKWNFRQSKWKRQSTLRSGLGTPAPATSYHLHQRRAEPQSTAANPPLPTFQSPGLWGRHCCTPGTRRGGQIPAPFHLCPTKSSGSVLLPVFIPFLELALQSHQSHCFLLDMAPNQ